LNNIEIGARNTYPFHKARRAGRQTSARQAGTSITENRPSAVGAAPILDWTRDLSVSPGPPGLHRAPGEVAHCRWSSVNASGVVRIDRSKLIWRAVKRGAVSGGNQRRIRVSSRSQKNPINLLFAIAYGGKQGSSRGVICSADKFRISQSSNHQAGRQTLKKDAGAVVRVYQVAALA
jgi:hypothetical protein